MPQQGYIAHFTEFNYPPQQAGELLDEADFVGIREDADSILKMFKAFAGVTAGEDVQLAAQGVVLRTVQPNGYDGIWVMVRVNLIDVTTGGGLLEGLLNGELVYLSNTEPGHCQIEAPATVGELLQVVGTAFYDKKSPPRAGDLAGGYFVHIEQPSVVPA